MTTPTQVLPSQVFPPWLTPVPITTEINGVPVVETSIEFIPLTYFGPSIPLGSVFTFGGSTFPPTVIFGPQSTSTLSVSPSSTSISSQSTSTTSLSSSIPTLSSTSLSTSPSASPSQVTSLTSTASSSPAEPANSPLSSPSSHGLSLGTKLAIGLSIAVVAILLFVLLLVLLKVRRRRSLRRVDRHSDGDWQIVGGVDDVDQDGVRTGEREVLLPEERVMRHRASMSTTPMLTPYMRTAYQPVNQTVADPIPRTSQNSTGSAAAEGIESFASQFSTSRSTMTPSALFYNSARLRGDTTRGSDEYARRSGERSDGRGSYTRLPPGASPPLLPPRSYGRSPSFLLDEDQFIPPEILLDSTPRSRSRHQSTESLPYPESPSSEVDERATLLTAQRVDLGPQVSVSTVGNRRPSPDNVSSNRGSPSLGTSLAGLSALAGLSRFSWFQRIQNQPPRHSSPPLSTVDSIHRTSSFNRLSFHPASRPHSAIWYPGHDSRPTSGFRFLNLPGDELGLRPPTAHFSSVGHSSGSRGSASGSGQSGQTVYHSATSRPQSFRPSSTLELPRNAQLIDLSDTSPGINTLGATAGATIRAIDVLDMPVPEPTLPLQAALSPDNIVSRSPSPGGSPRFPPGLVAIPRWNSESSSDHREIDVLDQAPPASPGEWSSLKSKGGVSPVEREVEIEHNVEVTSTRGPISEEAVVEPSNQYFMLSPMTPGFSLTPVTAGFSLSPRVSLHAPSDHISHHTGSHSSRGRASEHTTFEPEPHYDDQLSDDDYRPPVVQRASLSAIGGNRLRQKSSAVASRVLPAPEERSSEEEKSRTGSRPGSIVSGASRHTTSETVVSRSPSNPTGQPFESIFAEKETASIIDMLLSFEQE